MIGDMNEKPSKHPRGRPQLPTEDRMGQVTVRLRPALMEKVKANGGSAWIRQLIERAKPGQKRDPD